MLAVPAEMYNFGTQLALLGIMAFPATVVVMYLFIPMFYNLQCDSSFEASGLPFPQYPRDAPPRPPLTGLPVPLLQYLELRFDKTARKLGSFMFTLGMVTLAFLAATTHKENKRSSRGTTG